VFDTCAFGLQVFTRPVLLRDIVAISPGSTMHLKYRPEIDGLRAIAVLAVIFYHAEISFRGMTLLEGGFIGVDIFFVISGYLITSIILRELNRRDFSLRNFYERRSRRILPPLFLMFSICTYVAWQELMPKAFYEYSNSLLSSLGFSSNFWFWLEDSYTAEASAVKPLLHTWSLSVEEQFYLLFPVFLFLLWKFARKYVLASITVALLLSLQLADYASEHSPDAAFYLLHTRAWELLAGALLAKMELHRGRMTNSLLSSTMPALGMMLIIYSIIFFEDSMQHPSLITLQPVIGTMLVIWFCGREDLVSKILSCKPFVAVGLVSYSLYLWHAPVFAFARIKYAVLSNLEMTGLILLSIVLATASYYFIERPFRDRNRVSIKVLVATMGVTALSLIMINNYVRHSSGAPSRLGDHEVLLTGLNGNRSYKMNERRCHNRGILDACSQAPKMGNKTILSIGDSHAGALGSALLNLAEMNGLGFTSLTKGGCPSLSGLTLYKRDGKGKLTEKADCTRYGQELLRFIEEYPASIIVYSARLPLYLSGERFDNLEGGIEPGGGYKLVSNVEGATPAEVLSTRLQQWVDLGHTLVLVYPVPEVGLHIPNRFRTLLKNTRVLSDRMGILEAAPVTTSYSVYKNRTEKTNAILHAVTGDSNRLIRVYPNRLLCSESTQRCRTHSNEALYYFDDDHLSIHGAKLVVDVIERKLSLQ